MRKVLLDEEPVELYKVLKFSGLADSGGLAKLLVDNGDVKVNEAVERKKRKKIMSGDTIECGGEKIQVALLDQTVS